MAALLTSELVTNAVVHGCADVDLLVRESRGVVRVEVGDTSDRMPVPRPASLDALGGRGLFLVDHLADAWGVERRQRGKAVWFEVRTRRPGG